MGGVMKTFAEWLEEKGIVLESRFVCTNPDCKHALSSSGVSEPEKIRCQKCGSEMRREVAKAA